MERLTVKNLGPLKDFTLETNRLTVIIGPQASGKSLLAQMLFFFNEFKQWIIDNSELPFDHDDWLEDAAGSFLSRLRGVSISNFTSRNTSIAHMSNGNEFTIKISNSRSKTTRTFEHLITLNEPFKNEMASFVSSLFKTGNICPYRKNNQIFIPTERSLYTRFSNIRRGMLYSGVMPYTITKFAENIDECSNDADFAYYNKRTPLLVEPPCFSIYNKIIKQQVKALGGEVRLSPGGTQSRDPWSWSIEGNVSERYPLGVTSSGQMETWPFFILAAVFGARKYSHDFYFEEPETHLHPRAQVEVIRTIAYLLSLGHRFVITTHSPFILYVINTLIQAHIAYDGAVPEGEFSINPDHVAAYSLGEKSGSIVNPETRLLDLTEIDSVFDEINVSFGKYMDMEFAKHEK